MSFAYTREAGGGEKSSAPIFIDRVKIVITGETYSTGGIAIDILGELSDDLRGRTLKSVSHISGAGYLAEYDHATDKLKVFTSNSAAPAALAEYPDSTSLTATVELLVVTV